jgi:putative nucleotidyltransferase with HDIG domain
MPALTLPKINRKGLYLAILMLATGGISFLSLVLPRTAELSRPPLRAGTVAAEEYLAPHALTYLSEVRTEQARQNARQSTPAVYTPVDTSVARTQLERLRVTISYISTVRADTYSNLDQKLADLAELEYLDIKPELAENILGLSASRWQVVQQETVVVLEQVMRNTIRDDQLVEARQGIPSLISLALPVAQSEIVAQLSSTFVVPNSLYDAEATQEARKAAAAAVEPILQSYAVGETIVSRGSLITEEEYEALEQFGLLKSTIRWQDYASAAALVMVASFFMLFYIAKRPGLAIGRHSPRALTLISVIFLVFLTTARLLIPGHTVLPYLYPMAAYSLTVASLFGAEAALVSALPLAILSTFGLPFSLDLTLYYVLGSFFGVFFLGRGHRITSFLWSGFAIAIFGALVVIAYRFSQPSTDMIGLATLAGASLINGAASAGAGLILQFLLAPILGKTTALQLVELSRPDHPLLQLLLRNAPGTYQHSLQVANLSEQAAEAIGADALLTRVAALYHDVGKANDPFFFIENQSPGNLNPHDDLDPLTSSKLIRSHVESGLAMARKYRIPRRIQDFIAEHHGDMLTRYQYSKAVQIAGGDESQIEPELFRYRGPRPQSRESAILMLADGVEARVRAEHPRDESQLRDVIRSVIQHRVSSGELDDAPLTLQDLQIIEGTFFTSMRSVFHPRIQYPGAPDAIPAIEAPTDNASLPPSTGLPELNPPTVPSANP